MKRFLAIIPLLLALIFFSSCSTELIYIEDCEWKMRTVMSNSGGSLQNGNDFVIVVGEPDEVYPDAKIIELTLTAQNGELILTDATNGKTYNGTYNVSRKTIKSIDYEITIDGIQGYATISKTKYYDGSETPTLPINFGNYALYFIPNN